MASGARGSRTCCTCRCRDGTAFAAPLGGRAQKPRRHRGQALKSWTITSALQPVSIILAQAARRGRIPVNPMTQLERGERPKHDDQRPKRILSLEEMQALLDGADSEAYRWSRGTSPTGRV